MADENIVYGWDSEIEDDGGQYIHIPEGEHTFTITKLDKSDFNGSEHIPPCPMATVTFEVATAEGNAYATKRFYLCGKFEKTLTGFFRSIGMKKKGEKIVMKWSGIIGKRGRAMFVQEADRNDAKKTYNSIKYFVDYDESKMNPAGFAEVTGDDIPF